MAQFSSQQLDFNVLSTAQGHLRSITSLQGHKIRNLRSAAHCFMMEQNTLISLLYTENTKSLRVTPNSVHVS